MTKSKPNLLGINPKLAVDIYFINLFAAPQ